MPVAWLAVKYSKTISNGLSQTAKDTIFRQFARESYLNFMWQPLDKFTYLERVYQGADVENYNKAINEKGDVADDMHTILTPKYEPFADHNGDKLKWLFISLLVGPAIFGLLLMARPLRDKREMLKSA